MAKIRRHSDILHNPTYALSDYTIQLMLSVTKLVADVHAAPEHTLVTSEPLPDMLRARHGVRQPSSFRRHDRLWPSSKMEPLSFAAESLKEIPWYSTRKHTYVFAPILTLHAYIWLTINRPHRNVRQGRRRPSCTPLQQQDNLYLIQKRSPVMVR